MNRKLCFAGGIVRKWAHENIISVLDECDAKYVLAGTSSKEYLNELMSLPNGNRIEYKGVLDVEDIPLLIKSCAVGMAVICPSGATFGNSGSIGITKLFEYLLHGIPIICTNFLHWKNIVETENCGICVDPNDTTAIKDAVTYLLDNPDIAVEMGRNGHAAVISKYNWTTQESVLLDVYKSLSGNHSKKVCHITSVHPARDQRIFHKQCASLAKAGYETYLVAQGHTFRDKDVNVVGLGKCPSSRIKRMFHFSRTAYEKALEINTDIYHLHDPELLQYALKLKKQGKRVIYDSHEDYTQTLLVSAWIPKPFRRLVTWLYKVVEKRVLSKIDAVIYVTPAQLDRLGTYNPNAYMITNYPIITFK